MADGEPMEKRDWKTEFERARVQLQQAQEAHAESQRIDFEAMKGLAGQRDAAIERAEAAEALAEKRSEAMQEVLACCGDSSDLGWSCRRRLRKAIALTPAEAQKEGDDPPGQPAQPAQP